MTAKRTPPQPLSGPELPESTVPWVECAIDDAPVDDLPMTDEEQRLVAEARANFARTGETRTPEQIRATIEEMRRRQEG